MDRFLRSISIVITGFGLLVVLSGCTGRTGDAATHVNAHSTRKTNDAIRSSPLPSPLRADERQRILHAEEPVENRIVIPEDVLATIVQTLENIPGECLNREAVDPCFVGAHVSINGDVLDDIAVMAQGKLLGANVTRFWVFLGTADGYRLVLSDTGLELVIGDFAPKGFAKIDIVRMSARRIFVKSFEYSGKEYSLVKEYEEDI